MSDMKSLIERLATFDTPTVSDALDALGAKGTVSGIAPMWPSGRIAGRVQTLELGPASEHTGPTTRHLGAQSISDAESGDVIVVDNRAGQGFSAGWGGLLALAASLKGIAGVVVYGAARDIDDVAEVGLPLFAHCATPRTARARTVEVSTNEPLVFEEVVVSAGDLVIADRSGVVFIAIDLAEQVLAKAKEVAGKEREMAAQLRHGVAVTDVLAGNYETMLRPN
jgi:4-hydroxy-4-methyl-2-oxoglutarate aldolase